MKIEELYAKGDVFLGKRGKKEPSPYDVSITKRSDKGAVFNITFRNEASETYIFSKMIRVGRIITPDTKRIYFINAGDKLGYKITRRKGYGVITFSDKSLESFTGDYNLIYDPECDLVYIDKDKKIRPRPRRYGSNNG